MKTEKILITKGKKFTTKGFKVFLYETVDFVKIENLNPKRGWKEVFLYTIGNIEIDGKTVYKSEQAKELEKKLGFPTER